MKFIHLSDLHLGKRVNEFSMLEDQKYILLQILQIIKSEKPDGILIAGDIYDKSIPPAEAVQLFDDFLTRLAELAVQVFIISGNHDSAERIAFGSRLMGASGIHMCPVYDGTVTSFTMEDAIGPVNIYLLPFLKPAHVRRFFPDASIETYTDALRTVIGSIDLQKEQRNLAVTHQFVTGAARSESEDLTVGGTDNVDAEVFEAFDYVALGHIHGPLLRHAAEVLLLRGQPQKIRHHRGAFRKGPGRNPHRGTDADARPAGNPRNLESGHAEGQLRKDQHTGLHARHPAG